MLHLSKKRIRLEDMSSGAKQGGGGLVRVVGWLFAVPGRNEEKLQISIFRAWGLVAGEIGLFKEFGSIQQILISLLLHRGGCRRLSEDIALVSNSSDTFTITKLFLGKNPKVPTQRVIDALWLPSVNAGGVIHSFSFIHSTNLSKSIVLAPWGIWGYKGLKLHLSRNLCLQGDRKMHECLGHNVESEKHFRIGIGTEL